MNRSALMRPDCRAVVGIVARSSETGLFDTLNQYKKQDVSVPFEVNVLVNALHGVDISRSEAYQQVLEFMKINPDLHVALEKKNYSEIRIGELRGDVAQWSLERARVRNVDLRRLVLVSADADLISLPCDFISRCVGSFDEMEFLNGIAGRYDYPCSYLAENHLHLAVVSFIDVLDYVQMKEDGYIIFKGGNSAFRAINYIRVGGHNPRATTYENRSIFESLKSENPKSVGFDPDLYIVTSPRRQQVARGAGRLYVTSGDFFGTEDDLVSHHLLGVTQRKLYLPSEDVRSSEFPQALQMELQRLFTRKLGNLARSVGWDVPKDKEVLLYRDTFRSCQNLYPDDIEKLKNRFRDIGHTVGVEIVFDGENILTEGISVLERRIMLYVKSEKDSRYRYNLMSGRFQL